MSKLHAFFEKKKKKPLKSTLPAALDEKPKEAEELPLEVGASIILPEEQEAGSWIVEPEGATPPQEGSSSTAAEGSNNASASWLKVSVVSAASVRKKEPLPTWNLGFGPTGAGDGDNGRSDTDAAGVEGGVSLEGAEPRGAGGEGDKVVSGGAGIDSQQASNRSLSGLDALLNSNGSDTAGGAGRKWIPPSLRARMAGGGGGSGARGSSSKPNFEGDQDLTTVAQLGLYCTPGSSMQDAAIAMKKKKQQQQQQSENSSTPASIGGDESGGATEVSNGSSNIDKKKKKKGGATGTTEDALSEGGRGGDSVLNGATTGTEGGTGDGTATAELFDVWKFVQLDAAALNFCNAAQNNELVKEKYLNRARWGEDVATLQAQSPVA